MAVRNTFEGFVLEGADKLSPSEYCNTRIEIAGLYGWGVGYYPDMQKRFMTEVHDAFKKAGYSIEERNWSASADYLMKENSKLRLYMHPMAFTGPATPEQIDEITEILNSFDYIQAEARNASPLYELTDDEYRDMIYDNAESIAAVLLESRNDIFRNYDAGFEFAEACRIDRVCKPTNDGYNSMETDIAAIGDIRKECISLKQNTNLSDKEIAKAVGETAQE